MGRGQGVRRGMNGEGRSAHELVVRLLLGGGYPNPGVTLTLTRDASCNASCVCAAGGESPAKFTCGAHRRGHVKEPRRG